jgi:CRISPR-associated protein Cst1
MYEPRRLGGEKMAIYQALMGNPFVDAGISAICAWTEKEAEDITQADVENMIDRFAPVMCTPAWSKNLYSIFPNNPVTNSSIKDSLARLRLDWESYLSAIEELGDAGDCAGCGRREARFHLIRKDVPMTGSGKLRNFFPLFSEGMGYCAACALAIQFAPLAFVASGGRFLMLHSNSWRVQRFWARTCVRDIRAQMSRKEITGCFNRGYTNPRNGLFAMTEGLMSHYETRWSAENATMQVYCFSNYQQSPELDIYLLPADVFRFLAYVWERQFQTAWREIVRSGYKRVNWDKVESEDEYKNRANLVYEWLLEGRSILGFFLNRSERQTRGDWELITLYLKEVRHMDEDRLAALKRVGDAVAESIRQSGSIRRLGQLERAGSYTECRNVLRFVIRDRIAQGQAEPLFSLDEYVEHLFPETAGELTVWRETRDLLLFRIYETLHDWLRARELPEVVEEAEEETED